MRYILEYLYLYGCCAIVNPFQWIKHATSLGGILWSNGYSGFLWFLVNWICVLCFVCLCLLCTPLVCLCLLCTVPRNPTTVQLPPINNKVAGTKTARLLELWTSIGLCGKQQLAVVPGELHRHHRRHYHRHHCHHHNHHHYHHQHHHHGYSRGEGGKTLLSTNFMQIWNVSITRRLFKSNKAIARLQHAIKAIAAQMLHYNGPRFSILTQTHLKKQNAAVSPVSINHDLIWYDISGLISKCGRTMWDKATDTPFHSYKAKS